MRAANNGAALVLEYALPTEKDVIVEAAVEAGVPLSWRGYTGYVVLDVASVPPSVQTTPLGTPVLPPRTLGHADSPVAWDQAEVMDLTI
jgi:hypothetical protein